MGTFYSAAGQSKIGGYAAAPSRGPAPVTMSVDLGAGKRRFNCSPGPVIGKETVHEQLHRVVEHDGE